VLDKRACVFSITYDSIGGRFIGTTCLSGMF